MSLWFSNCPSSRPKHARQRARRAHRGCNGFARARSLRPAGATLTAPTTNATFATGTTNLTLTGIAGDTTAAVFALNAYNVQSAGFSLVAGTGNWTASNVPLLPAATNRIIVTAIGTSWSPILGGNTSFNTSLLVTQVATPITMTISTSGPEVSLGWAGGAPPNVVQQCTNLSTGVWQNVQTNTGNTTQLARLALANFYRVQGQ